MIFLMGCQTKSMKAQSLNLKWDFLEYPPGERRACLSQDDVTKLREYMIVCESLRDKCGGI
jgi:hypothetical protein